MPASQTRRRFLITLSGAGAAGLAPTPRALAAEGSLETTSLRLFKSSLICSAAPQYAAEELLRAEGFKDIAYVEAARNELPQVFADGKVDFTVTFAVNHLLAIDHGAPITILAGDIRVATSCSRAKTSTASPNSRASRSGCRQARLPC